MCLYVFKKQNRKDTIEDRQEKKVSHMFCFDVTKKSEPTVDSFCSGLINLNIFSFIESLENISIFDISNKSYCFIFNYVSEHKDKFVKKINHLRTFIHQSWANSNSIILSKETAKVNLYTTGLSVVKTTGDGNCLYHSISISISGA